MFGMLLKFLGYGTTANAAPATMAGKPRSPHWDRVRREFLEDHPACAVCGTTEGIEVHHVRPYHEWPELELDPTNLITLCQSRGHHFTFGHLCDWRNENRNVRFNADEWARKIHNQPRN